MTITKSSLPDRSLLHRNGMSYDYVDSFQREFIGRNEMIDSVELGKSFFMGGPKWVEKLFTFRNKIVGVLGLKTNGQIKDRAQLLNNFTCEKGEQLGLFKVFDRTMNEVILGEDDKHLNFRVSLFLDQEATDLAKKKLTVSTTVTFNNWFGRLYFIPVRPFHKIIVPTMVKGIIKNLEQPQP